VVVSLAGGRDHDGVNQWCRLRDWGSHTLEVGTDQNQCATEPVACPRAEHRRCLGDEPEVGHFLIALGAVVRPVGEDDLGMHRTFAVPVTPAGLSCRYHRRFPVHRGSCIMRPPWSDHHTRHPHNTHTFACVGRSLGVG
jgi:hypothetical protein